MIRSILVSLAAIVAAIGMVCVAGPAAAAGPSGCGYGTVGAEAGALCWLDMSTYNENQAKSPAGQQMSVTLPGGYHVSFTVHSAKNGSLPYTSLHAVAFPTWSGAFLGNLVYKSTPGKPALYGSSQGGGTLMTLDSIAVTDVAGQPVNSYGFVIADAESSDTSEKITFGSDKLLNAVYPATSQYPYCTGGLIGLGSAQVTCTGGPHSGPNGAIALQADAPSMVSAALVHGGIQGVSFAVVTSAITLTKQVVRRVSAGDAFDLSVVQDGGTLGSAHTGAADSATTGSLTVLSPQDVQLSESGIGLGGYTQDWSCQNSATSSTTVLPSGSGTAKQLSLQPGDDVTCTLTNSGPPIVDTPMADATVIGILAGLLALVGGAVLLRRRRDAA